MMLFQTGSKKVNRYIFRILFLIAIIVWSNFFFRVKGSLKQSQQEQKNTEEMNAKSYSKEKSLNIYFEGNFNDPFKSRLKPLPPEVKKTDKKKDKKKKRNKSVKPKLAFKGIIGKTALIESNKEVYFVQEGDSVVFGRIIQIQADSILIKFQDKDYIFKLYKSNSF